MLSVSDRVVIQGHSCATSGPRYFQIIGLNGYTTIINPGFYLDPEKSKIGLTVVAAIVCAFVGLILVFLVQLMLLHIGLIMKNMTTYEYIISKRDKPFAKEKAAQLELENGLQNESFKDEKVKTISENLTSPTRVKSASGTVVTVNDVNPSEQLNSA